MRMRGTTMKKLSVSLGSTTPSCSKIPAFKTVSNKFTLGTFELMNQPTFLMSDKPKSFETRENSQLAPNIQHINSTASKKKFILDIRKLSMRPFEYKQDQSRQQSKVHLQSTGADFGSNGLAECNDLWVDDCKPSNSRKLSLRLDPVLGDMLALPYIRTASVLKTQRQEETLHSLSLKPQTRFTLGNFSTKHIFRQQSNLSVTMKSIEDQTNMIYKRRQNLHLSDYEEGISSLDA
jgi:hypothetical protein